jgi:hypothetical protein
MNWENLHAYVKLKLYLNIHTNDWQPNGYWLLLQSGIVWSVPYNCDHFLIYCAPRLSSNHFRFIHHLSALVAAETSSSEVGRNLARNSRWFRLSVSIIPQGKFKLPNYVALLIFMALKNQFPSTEFEPTNLDNQYTTENVETDNTGYNDI